MPGKLEKILKYFGIGYGSSRTSPLPNNRVHEPFTGAWQKNIKYEGKESLLRYSAIYAAVTGIASDIGKLRIKLCEDKGDGVWREVKNNKPWLPVLRKPNNYQNRIEFLEQWMLSKLLAGNAYILKERNDMRGIVTGMHVLDPFAVRPIVLPDGAVYYQVATDWLAGLEGSDFVPASEMIHDRMPALWHPLVGVPPLYACVLSGTLGSSILKHATKLFDGRALPGGSLEVPGDPTDEEVKAIKKRIDEGYSGDNAGKVLVLTSGMKFNSIDLMTAQHAQLAEQLKLTVEDISRAYHYPMFKLGGPVPTLAGNVEAVITTYYTDCLQTLIEKCELCLDEGLELDLYTGTELDLEGLMRMDTTGMYEANTKAVGGGWMKPNEARNKANLEPVTGGDSPYLQQQNYSLAALAKRDSGDPFAKPQAPAANSQGNEDDIDNDDEQSLEEAKEYGRFTAHRRLGAM